MSKKKGSDLDVILGSGTKKDIAQVKKLAEQLSKRFNNADGDSLFKKVITWFKQVTKKGASWQVVALGAIGICAAIAVYFWRKDAKRREEEYGDEEDGDEEDNEDDSALTRAFAWLKQTGKRYGSLAAIAAVVAVAAVYLLKNKTAKTGS